jgi:hypothetical protein
MKGDNEISFKDNAIKAVIIVVIKNGNSHNFFCSLKYTKICLKISIAPFEDNITRATF